MQKYLENKPVLEHAFPEADVFKATSSLRKPFLF